MPRRRIRKKDIEMQPPVSDFFHPITKWMDPTIKNHPDEAFHNKAMYFRYNVEQEYDSWHYFGTFNYYCYYCDDGYNEFHVFSPLHNGMEVAKLSIDDEYFVYGIYVEPQFRLRGIGTQLIQIASDATQKERESNLLVLMGTPHMHNRQYPNEYYLSQEGMALIKSCYNKKILRNDQLIGNTPDISPVNSPSKYSAKPRGLRH